MKENIFVFKNPHEVFTHGELKEHLNKLSGLSLDKYWIRLTYVFDSQDTYRQHFNSKN